MSASSAHFALSYTDVEQYDGYRKPAERIDKAERTLFFFEQAYERLYAALFAPLPLDEKLTVVVQGNSIRVPGRKTHGVGGRGGFRITRWGLDASTVQHEMAHALHHTLVPGGRQTWFSEGLGMMAEHSLDRRWPKTRLSRWVGRQMVDYGGRNLLQDWGDARTMVRSMANGEYKAYVYSAYILTMLREAYGNEFYQRLFALMRRHASAIAASKDQDAALIACMSVASGEDLRPLFRDRHNFAIDDRAFELVMAEARAQERPAPKP